MKKPVRSQSGVTVLTVVTMPFACPHGRCVYCPGGGDVPNAYTKTSPAIMRALQLQYDPAKQVEARMRALKTMGHPASKIEVIIIGGTFLFFPEGYCESFVKTIFDSLNGVVSLTLEEAQRINETTEYRCVALCIETKPELCTKENIAKLLRYGVTRVEIGVQILDDDIYKRINRGHTVQDVVDATARLRDAGFKVGYHMMPGLPGSTPAHDLELFGMMFTDPRFMPDHLKIYPTQVVRDSPLEKLYERGDFKPYDDQTMFDLLLSMKVLVPPYCRIMRIQRQISSKLLHNPLIGDIRQQLQEKLREQGKECKCVRCNEIGFHPDAEGPWGIKTTTFTSNDGKEWFITWQNPHGVIVGLVRLRLPHEPFLPEITKRSLLVRELHVYGREVPIDTNGAQSQHKGVGKILMLETERIASEMGCDKIVVISGVGVRDYYRKLGYSLEGPYMVKALTPELITLV